MLIKTFKTGRKKPYGFTILEIMIATTIFGVILLILAAGILSFARNYFASVTRSTTQATARSAAEDIARAIQFSGEEPTRITTPTKEAVCIGNVGYIGFIGVKLTGTNHGLIKRVLPTGTISCSNFVSAFAYNAATDQELLAKNTRLSIMKAPSLGDGASSVHIRVVYGDDNLLNTSVTPSDWSDLQCIGGVDAQYCAVSDLTTTVQRRLE